MFTNYFAMTIDFVLENEMKLSSKPYQCPLCHPQKCMKSLTVANAHYPPNLCSGYRHLSAYAADPRIRDYPHFYKNNVLVVLTCLLQLRDVRKPWTLFSTYSC
jgi:hypothetical protein